MRRVLILPGSARGASLNRRLARDLARALRPRFDVDLVDPADVELPLFNQDREHDPAVRPILKALHGRLLDADGLLVVSPEYNGSLSTYLKNTIDWVSRLARIESQHGYPNPFQGKPVLLACATAGWTGGRLGLQSAAQLFTYLGGRVWPESILLPCAGEAWDDDGVLIDPFFGAHMQQILKQFALQIDVENAA